MMRYLCPRMKAKKIRLLVVSVLFFCLISNFTFAAYPTIPVLGISPLYGSSPPNRATTITCKYSDGDGWENLKGAYLLISEKMMGTYINAVYLYYDQNSNSLYLRNDENTIWLGGYAPGSSYVIENSQAKLNCASTTVSGSGDTLTVKFNITFKLSYSNRRYYTILMVIDDTNLVYGPIPKGTFTVNYNPTVGTITPSSGNAQIEVPITFKTTFSDGDGFQRITYVNFLMNTSTSGANCLYAYYSQSANKLYLRNDENTTWLGGYAPGSSYVIENSYAKVYCAATSVSGSGTTLTVNWLVALRTPFTGTKNTYLQVTDGLSSSNWKQKGTWTIQPDITPPVGTIKTIDYSYDDLNRLGNVTDNETSTTYTYDEVGNITNKTTVENVP